MKITISDIFDGMRSVSFAGLWEAKTNRGSSLPDGSG
jgi:hypothetical protein